MTDEKSRADTDKMHTGGAGNVSKGGREKVKGEREEGGGGGEIGRNGKKMGDKYCCSAPN